MNNLLVNIQDIPPEGLIVEIAEEGFSLGMEEEGVTLDEKVSGEIRITPVGSVMSMEGAVSAVLKGRCDRCLKPVRSLVRTEFATDYHPAVEMQEEHEHELIGHDLEIAYYHGEEIDIGDLVREQIILSMPMQMLCREDCEGICPHCGKDKNSGPCGCTVDLIDPRLAKLKDLLK